MGRITQRQQQLADPPNGLVNIVVLPHTDDLPPTVSEPRVGVAVTSDVALDLLSPEGCVRLGLSPMRGTTVPVAPINEHCQSLSRKDDVHPALYIGKHTSVDTEAEPPPMEGRAEF
jgi:hypothetical protein